MLVPSVPRWFGLALLISPVAACGADAGHDYATTVTWLINGSAPTTELCREQGVDRIRFTMQSPSRKHSLESPCDSRLTLSDGYDYGAFVTTKSFDYDVTYRYTVEMLDANGDVLRDVATNRGVTYSSSFRVFYGDEVPWVLQSLELFAPDVAPLSSVVGSWTIDGDPASASNCAARGGTEVAIDVASSTDADYVDSYELVRASCADGFVDSGDAVLGEGEYVVRYVLLDDKGKVLQSVPVDPLYIVDQAGELTVDEVDFN